MGGVRNEHTVNIVDAGIFRATGKPPNTAFEAVEKAVSAADQSLVLSRDIYRELGGNPESNPPPSASSFVGPGIDAGWIDVVDPLTGNKTVDEAIEVSEDVITGFMDHPKTAVASEDATNIGLAIQYFERNESLQVNLHTTDRALGEAAIIVIPEYGYHDITVNYVPPNEVSNRMTTRSVYTPPTVRQERSD